MTEINGKFYDDDGNELSPERVAYIRKKQAENPYGKKSVENSEKK